MLPASLFLPRGLAYSDVLTYFNEKGCYHCNLLYTFYKIKFGKMKPCLVSWGARECCPAWDLGLRGSPSPQAAGPPWRRRELRGLVRTSPYPRQNRRSWSCPGLSLESRLGIRFRRAQLGAAAPGSVRWAPGLDLGLWVSRDGLCSHPPPPPPPRVCTVREPTGNQCVGGCKRE